MTDAVLQAGAPGPAARPEGSRPGAVLRRAEARPIIEIDDVVKTFGEFVAVDHVSLTIREGELFALLGGSGCGKTTLLRMLAGFERPTAGRILIGGQDMTHVAPYDRPVNMMFQSYALFPHMSVEANVAFGLRQDGLPKAEIRDRVRQMLDLVQLAPFAKRKPHHLSGGQRQRVALARSLAKHPKVLLLDEPLAALDKKLREQTQLELVGIQERVGTTFVVVTHDQEEAMTMADRVAIMDSGRIIQVDTPHALYEYPNTRFVAEFFGTVNMFQGDLIEDEPDHILIRSDALANPVYVGHGISAREGATVWVALRPEKLAISRTRPDRAHNWDQGIIEDIVYLGGISTYHVRLDSGALARVTTQNLERMAEPDITWDDRVFVSWRHDNVVVVTG
ncbi:ABC transporter ATP-binding protein [Roseospira navarrensis]|uniref:Spermidine/putrescine import ATP-binding protein PotA n=1 Tax=Roseospira navarrensis TaxID=140058 RepID=A0A7X2D434_9PROT|nr:polyamine ABC transporter ATP-binding protein [Roseospira navarrensis]MQX37508.1 polyamine ABC transporter ATP-binding protein [Roseospira navarrensis]